VKVIEAEILSSSSDCRGIARQDGKVWFVDFALPTEVVRFRVIKNKNSHGFGVVEEVLKRSPSRTEPHCEYFGICGGCALQHIEASYQNVIKQQVLLDQLERDSGIVPQQVLPPLGGSPWGYRRKARLGVRLVPKKGGVLVGFREKNKNYVTNLDRCLTLDQRISHLLPSLKRLITQLSRPDRIPQVEVAAGDNQIALVFRHLEALSGNDCTLLEEFARSHDACVYLQSGGVGTVKPLYPEEPPMLEYRFSKNGIRVQFSPTDFIQVNSSTNELMVQRAVELLELGPADNVLDLFCGVGNLTLTLASAASSVLGVEGDPGLVQRARSNVRLNKIGNAKVEHIDLYSDSIETWDPGPFNKVLIDPPRSGALNVCKWLVGSLKPERVIYISCNPATLARDLNLLVNEHGYILKRIGLIDMFPQTPHIESIAELELS